MRTIRVLMAVGDEGIQEVLEEIIRGMLKSGEQLETFAPASIHEDHLRQLAGSQPFDLCLVLLNNILFREHMPYERCRENSVALVQDLTTEYDWPVIALFGWEDEDGAYQQSVEAAGAFAVLPLRPNMREIIEAVRKALHLQD